MLDVQMVDGGLTESAAVHIVVLRDFLIARDIEMIIREYHPEDQVIVRGDLDQAEIGIPQARIRVVFVQGKAAQVAQSALAARVAADGGRTVLVGVEDHGGLPEGWSVLPFPFVDADVKAILAGTR